MSSRVLFTYAALALLTIPVTAALQYYIPLADPAVFAGAVSGPVMVGGIVVLTRVGWLPKPYTGSITENSREKIVLIMAGGLVVFIAGLAGVFRIESSLRYYFIFVAAAGFVALFYGAARFIVWLYAAREKPELFDERVKGNIRKADCWGMLAGLEVALILGLLDFTDTLPLSGAAVGFSAGISAVLVGLLSDAWLEWKDG